MSKFFIKTYGCALNQADSIIMKNLLKKSGFEQVHSYEDADIIIVNTCVVKEPTENKIIDYLKELDKKGKKLIITGCMVEVRSDFLKRKFTSHLLGCTNIFDIVKVCKGVMVESLNHVKCSKLRHRISKNEVIDIIPISEGCSGNCSYCITKLARGGLHSYSINSIIEQARRGFEKGVKELWLTSQDTGAYGLDNNSSIVELLNRLIQLPFFFKTRLGMMNPKHALKYYKRLAELLNDSKLFNFVHLPLQSGSDEVLESMNRGYTCEEFEKVHNYLKKKVPNLIVATDVILGFPGESDSDFKQTLDLIKRIEPEVLNISRYWKRKGTIAAGMNQLPHSVRKERTRKMMKLHKKILTRVNKKYIGRELNVLINGVNTGRSDSYKLVKTKGGLGEYKSVKITRIKGNSLIGKEL